MAKGFHVDHFEDERTRCPATESRAVCSLPVTSTNRAIDAADPVVIGITGIPVPAQKKRLCAHRKRKLNLLPTNALLLVPVPPVRVIHQLYVRHGVGASASLVSGSPEVVNPRTIRPAQLLSMWES